MENVMQSGHQHHERHLLMERYANFVRKTFRSEVVFIIAGGCLVYFHQIYAAIIVFAMMLSWLLVVFGNTTMKVMGFALLMARVILVGICIQFPYVIDEAVYLSYLNLSTLSIYWDSLFNVSRQIAAGLAMIPWIILALIMVGKIAAKKKTKNAEEVKFNIPALGILMLVFQLYWSLVVDHSLWLIPTWKPLLILFVSVVVTLGLIYFIGKDIHLFWIMVILIIALAIVFFGSVNLLQVDGAMVASKLLCVLIGISACGLSEYNK